MTVYEIIQEFIKKNNYIQDEHVLGILFYGSYQYGLNNPNSDIDLHIVFDDSIPNHLIRGNSFINDVRIEYFEKTISEIYDTIEDEYSTQNNASESIIGNAEIIYEKDNSMHALQKYVKSKFANGLPKLTDDEAKEQIAIINNRMEKLKKYAEENNCFFEHLYHLTIEKIRRFYHNLNGMPRIETYKGFKVYTDEKYQKMFSIDYIPDNKFLEMYFELIQNQSNDKMEKYHLLEKFYHYSKESINFNEHDYRISVKSRNDGTDTRINRDKDLSHVKTTNIHIPDEVYNTVIKFMKKKDYANNEHFLGMIVYGSSLTGFNTDISDIDVHVIFDNADSNRIIRGETIVNGKKIEYFEKPIDDVYLTAENEFKNQNNASFSIIGKGSIVFEKNNSLTNLKKYVIDRFESDLPTLDQEDAKEQISIIDNKIQKLENLANENSLYFNHLYHLTLEKMRKVYHRIIGIPKIPTSKVYKIYTDEPYRKSVYKVNPDKEFVEDYLNLMDLNIADKNQMLGDLKKFYLRIRQNVNLGNDYRISIKSKNKKNTLKSSENKRIYTEQGQAQVTSSEIAKLDKESNLSSSDERRVCNLFHLLKAKKMDKGEPNE